MYSEIKYFKVIKKYLSSQTFVEDGFKYDFNNIHEKDGAVFMTVAVTLPNPNQSWVAPKFSFDIQNILYTLQYFVGDGFSVSYMTTLNGRDVEDYGYCYVSPKKREEILNQLNSEIPKFYILKNGHKLSFNIFWKESKHKFYELDDTYLGFYFYLNVSNFEYQNNDVKPNMDMIDEIAGMLNEDLQDSDGLRSKVEDIIYLILEPEIRIREVDDVYLQMNTFVDKIDGYRTTPKWHHMDIDPDMFIPL